MDDAHAHDSHAAHPLAATLVMLVIVAIFSAIFTAMTKSFDVPVMVFAALATVYGLLQIWVIDKD